ncbi:hypothetical protein PIB30_061428 [Stylosanthes scabra]|uniref:Uncharacterized protein n=1 Tax=Stylosanthes scabra TaxID=79078 RepID=A0ABU6YIA9_9FABA|nr:hypothetical protein [Stylosanthes scabra]
MLAQCYAVWAPLLPRECFPLPLGGSNQQRVSGVPFSRRWGTVPYFAIMEDTNIHILKGRGTLQHRAVAIITINHMPLKLGFLLGLFAVDFFGCLSEETTSYLNCVLVGCRLVFIS